MAIREIRINKEPVLLQACKPIDEVTPHVQLLLEDMLDTLRATPGCTAISANQVGLLRRLVVVDLGSGPQKLVNPVITAQSGEQESFEECISFPYIHGIMSRPQKVTVTALDENGTPLELTAEDASATRLCHAIDHLNGKVFVDHVIRFVNMDEDNE